MTEQLHQESTTQGPNLPEVSRETFRPAVLPPEWSPEAREAQKHNTREFAPLETPKTGSIPDPGAVRNFEVLRAGDVLNVPTKALDEEGAQIPDAFSMTEYQVKSVGVVDGVPVADIVDPSGIEEFIDADVFAGQQKDLQNLKRTPDDDLGVAVAKQLLAVDGIDVHDPATKLIEKD